MFNGCTIPIIGNLTDFRAPKLINAEAMFQAYTGNGLDLDGLQMSQVTNAKSMFRQYAAEALTLNGLQTNQLVDASYMFQQYDSSSLDLNGLITDNLVDAEHMLQFTTAFANVNVTLWNTSSLQKVQHMFHGCNNIVPVFTNWNLGGITPLNCGYVILSTTSGGAKAISVSSDYDQILSDWYLKTNSTGLICNWNSGGGGIIAPIPLTATTFDGLTARYELCTRGWAFHDGNGQTTVTGCGAPP